MAALAAAVAIAGCAGGANPDADTDTPPTTTASDLTSGGRIASHGMVLTGVGDAAFISHVPLFEIPHDVQIVAQGKVESLDGSPIPSSFTEQLFTFLPAVFSLDNLRNGVLKTLDGQIFLGSNEHNGRAIPGKFRFTVTQVIHQHVLDAKAPPSKLAYFVFGSKERAFAVHKIAGAPSFDEVLHVTLGGTIPSNDELAAGVEAEVGGSNDLASARIGDSDSAVTVQNSVNGKSFTVKRASALSCLVSPEFFDSCR